MRVSHAHGPRRRRLRRGDARHAARGIWRSATRATRPPATARSPTRSRFLIDCAHGQIAIAHNGNLVNAQELRDELVRHGSIFQTQQRHRSHAAPVRALEGADRRRRARRVDLAGQRRVLARAADEGPPDCGARSARLPSARARPARRRLDRVLGNLRARSDRRDLRPRRRAGRGGGHQRRRPAVDQAVSAGAARAVRVRARLLRAARQLRVRPQRQRSAHRPRADARARGAGRRRRRRADPRLGRVRGDRLSPKQAGIPLRWG